MKNENSVISGGFCGILTIVFMVLKLTGVISWSWWWILLPIYIWIPITLLLLLLLYIVVLIRFIIGKQQ